MSQNRYVVVPTVTVLAVMKARLTGAVKGHALLKKKADALTVRYERHHPEVQVLPLMAVSRGDCKNASHEYKVSAEGKTLR